MYERQDYIIKPSHFTGNGLAKLPCHLDKFSFYIFPYILQIPSTSRYPSLQTHYSFYSCQLSSIGQIQFVEKVI